MSNEYYIDSWLDLEFTDDYIYNEQTRQYELVGDTNESEAE